MKDAKSVLQAAQLNALAARLKAGRPLTDAQMRFVENFKSGGAQVAATNEDDVASSPSDLARRLGVSRQIISYHRTRAGSPQQLRVSDWRDYLTMCGKAVADRMGSSSSRPTGAGASVVAGLELVSWFEKLSDSLAVIVTASAEHAGVKIAPEQADVMTVGVWTLLAELLDDHLVKNGHERFWLERDEPEADGTTFQTEIPAGIAEVVRRVNARTTKAKASRKRKPTEATSDNQSNPVRNHGSQVSSGTDYIAKLHVGLPA